MAVLGIDETRRGKPIWGPGPGHRPVADRARPVAHRHRRRRRHGGLLAHIDGRTAAAVTDWLTAQPDPWRAGITHVTIDLSASYAKAVTDALPDAVLVADRFHLVQLANTMLTEVRQRATRAGPWPPRTQEGPRVGRPPAAAIGYERLTPDAFTRLWNALIDAGDPGIEILHAYTVKEELRRLLALPGTADREVISHRLWRFYSQAAASDSPEVHRLAETIEAWWPAVQAAITTGHSNARSEGYNRLAKHVGRNAFGFRNPTTKDDAYGGPAPANTGERQSGKPTCPAKFEEPGYSTRQRATVPSPVRHTAGCGRGRDDRNRSTLLLRLSD